MSDYIKREDAKRAIRRNFHDIETRCMINNIINEVAKVSSDNLVEVVRCKDCKHIKEEHFNIMPDGFSCELSGLMVEQEHYCSYGERAEDEQIH